MRRTLALLGASGLLPIIALGAIIGTTTLRDQRRAVVEQARSHADFAATLIGKRLIDQKRQVSLLTLSPAFDGTLDVDRFRLLAGRALAIQPGWRTLSVADIHGTRVLDVPFPIGGRQRGPVMDRDSLDRAINLHLPAIGRPLRGPNGRLAFAVRAPVVRDGAVVSVLSAVVPTASLAKLVGYRPLPADWRAVVVDEAGVIVVKATSSGPLVGQRASAPALAARTAGNHDIYEYTRTDGTPAVGVFSLIPETN